MYIIDSLLFPYSIFPLFSLNILCHRNTYHFFIFIQLLLGRLSYLLVSASYSFQAQFLYFYICMLVSFPFFLAPFSRGCIIEVGFLFAYFSFCITFIILLLVFTFSSVYCIFFIFFSLLHLYVPTRLPSSSHPFKLVQ